MAGDIRAVRLLSENHSATKSVQNMLQAAFNSESLMSSFYSNGENSSVAPHYLILSDNFKAPLHTGL